MSRGWLGVCAALVVLVAVAAAFGLAIACGAVFSATASIAVFLILGIGLDDAFVICGAEANRRGTFAKDALAVADGANVETVAAKRVQRAMETAGPSIFVTSITDFCAFVAGSFTTIPAIEAFCVFCATAVLADYLLQTTLFVACMTLDMRRKLRRGGREVRGDASKCALTKKALGDPKIETERSASFFGGRYARCLLSTPGMALVLSATAGLGLVGAVGSARVTAEFDYEWFITDQTNDAWRVSPRGIVRTSAAAAALLSSTPRPATTRIESRGDGVAAAATRIVLCDESRRTPRLRRGLVL